ncbi:hypothetical protein ACLOJK_037648 [Asimina triloba]
MGGRSDGKALLTPPLALEGGLAADFKAPSGVKLILSLFKNIQPGSELTRFQATDLKSSKKLRLRLGTRAVQHFWRWISAYGEAVSIGLYCQHF